MKRSPIYALSLVLVLAATDGQAQVKKNDVFGFGRKRNQISNALFPGGTETGTGPAPEVEKPTVKRDSDTIFRGGKPKKIESAAYLIKDGEKIEQPMPEPKTKPSLFSKFRKNDAANSPLLTATNASVEEEEKPNRILSPIPLKKEKPDPVVSTSADPVVSTPVEKPSEAPVAASAEPAFTAAPMEEKKSGGLFSFFSRDKKKNEPVVSTPVPVATALETPSEAPAMVSPATVVESSGIPDAPDFADSAPATTPVAPKPVAKPAPKPATPAEAKPVEDVPQFVGVENPSEEKKKGFSLPNPISKLKPEPKPVSMVGAVTIIENGEIVKEQEDIVDSNMVETGDGEREPPRVVDGVKTYNSWDDVEARSVSAADRILSQMRQR